MAIIQPIYITSKAGEPTQLKCARCQSANYGRGWPDDSPYNCKNPEAAVMCADCGDHGYAYQVARGANLPIGEKR